MACLGGLGVASILQSCTSSQYVAKSEVEGEYLKVLLTEFSAEKKYALVRSEQLNFPIYLYQVTPTEYSAVWMECTHQGAELSAHGEVLTCPAHGSEFDKTGQVMQGPAQNNLRKFKTKTDSQYVFIHLS
ncbi:MAG: Rieske Fe-S protein [Chitinophagaceae bacterium]|nr:Rieske Fe-S protein [Chitinophagaceae bacterium]